MIKDGAIECQQKYGVLASLTMAQAILESGWGDSSLSKNANNYFGIKAGSSWGGDYVEMQTKEYDGNGNAYMTTARFRKYADLKGSILDHAMLFVNNKGRYGNLLGETNYREACRKVREDGYATDPSYSQLLINIIEQNNLQQYDNVQVQEPTPQPQPQQNIYVVQSGDTLSAIGRKFGVNYMDIARANGISNPNVISVSQRLVIPTNSAPQPTPQPQPQVDNNIYGVVTASVLNVRNGRGTNYAVIGTLKNGEKVRLDQLFSDGWWSVYYGNHGGFVSAKYIQRL